MTDFVSGLTGAIKQAACQTLDASEAFGNSLVYAWQQGTGLTGVNPPNFASIAKGFLCGNPSPQLPPATGTPQGGQCSCIEYGIFGYLTRNAQPNLYFNNTRVWGPIEGVVAVPGGFNPPFVTTYNVICGGGVPGPCIPGTQVSIGAGASDGNITSYVITAIRRNDGLPDDCGEPPPPVTDPIPPPGIEGDDITFVYSPGGDTTGNLSVTLSPIFIQPRLNFNGQLIIPFTAELNIDLGGVNFNVTGNINVNTGDVNFNFGRGPGIKEPGYDNPCDEETKPVRDEPDPVLPLPTPPDDPDVDEETVIVAVLVQTSSASLQAKASLIPQGGNPTIYAPSLGHVAFYVPTGQGGGRAWTSDIPVKNTYQLIPCPWDLGAVGVSGTPNQGVSWSLTPIRRTRPKVLT